MIFAIDFKLGRIARNIIETQNTKYLKIYILTWYQRKQEVKFTKQKIAREAILYELLFTIFRFDFKRFPNTKNHRLPVRYKNLYLRNKCDQWTTMRFLIKHFLFQVWFKNRRAKWRKQKREEQERMRKLQLEQRQRADDNVPTPAVKVPEHLTLTRQQQQQQHEQDTDSSDLEVA